MTVIILGNGAAAAVGVYLFVVLVYNARVSFLPPGPASPNQCVSSGALSIIMTWARHVQSGQARGTCITYLH
jgi:hypothetical protein